VKTLKNWIRHNENQGKSKAQKSKPNSVHNDTTSLVKSFARDIDQDGQFFVVIRRGAPFHRILSLWQREASKSSPQKVLRINYVGERGIDTGAVSKEFFAEAMSNMKINMFPDGAPVDSIYNVHNKSFKTCGQIDAVSLAQGGPPPCFLDESVYQLILDPHFRSSPT